METMNTTTTKPPIPYPLDVVVIDDEETFTEGCRQTLEMGGSSSTAYTTNAVNAGSALTCAAADGS